MCPDGADGCPPVRSIRRSDFCRANGWCARSLRTPTFLAALRRDGPTAPLRHRRIGEPINGASVRPYVEQVLAPILAIKILASTLGAHKAGFAAALAARLKLLDQKPTLAVVHD